MSAPDPAPSRTGASSGAPGGLLLAAAAALLSGALSSLQSRANGELSSTWSSPVSASLWSFGSGLAVLTVMLLHPPARAGLVRVVRSVRDGRLRRWELLGGVLGGLFVTVQTFAVPAIGVALFTVALVGGQTGNALLVDRLGIGPNGRSPVTPTRATAAALTFAGVALAATSRGGAGRLQLLPVVLAVLAGAGMAVQGAVNGRVNRTSRHPTATTWVNFAFGSGFLLALAAVELGSGHAHLPHHAVAPWWALTGGVIGVIYIGINAAAVARLGVLVMTLLILTGQLVAAVVLDALAHHPPGARLLAGVAITLAAAGWSAAGARRG